MDNATPQTTVSRDEFMHCDPSATVVPFIYTSLIGKVKIITTLFCQEHEGATLVAAGPPQARTRTGPPEAAQNSHHFEALSLYQNFD